MLIFDTFFKETFQWKNNVLLKKMSQLNDSVGFLESFIKHALETIKRGSIYISRCYSITCNALPQYLWQGIHPNSMLQEIL